MGILPAATLTGSFNLSTIWRGPIVGSRDSQHLTAYQAILVQALRAADIQFTFEPIFMTLPDQKGVKSEAVLLLIAPPEG